MPHGTLCGGCERVVPSYSLPLEGVSGGIGRQSYRSDRKLNSVSVVENLRTPSREVVGLRDILLGFRSRCYNLAQTTQASNDGECLLEANG